MSKNEQDPQAKIKSSDTSRQLTRMTADHTRQNNQQNKYTDARIQIVPFEYKAYR